MVMFVFSAPWVSESQGKKISIDSGWADPRTVGLLSRDYRAFEGYNLFKTLPGDTYHLTNNAGRVIHEWNLGPLTRGCYYLLDDGHLLLGKNRQTVLEYDWDGALQWVFDKRPSYYAHHDWYKTAYGTVLIIAWEPKTYSEAIDVGRDPELLPDGGTLILPDAILEYDPIKEEIIWEWHTWDHLIQDYKQGIETYGVVSEHPEKIDVNYYYGDLILETIITDDGSAVSVDWQHCNAINYNPYLDQIAISVPTFGEIWIIDHNTTTEQAKGQAGDLLYRWGNPAAYGRGTESDMKLEFQHDVHWINPGLPGEGNLLIFNNGRYRGFSSVLEIVTPVDSNGNYTHPVNNEAFGPSTPVWEYEAPEPDDFYSMFISGAQRLPNGNTVINEGMKGHFFEVTQNGEIVWEYINPVKFAVGEEEPLTQGDSLVGTNRNVHRMIRYAPDYDGLADRDLTPGELIEEYPYEYFVDIKPESVNNPVSIKSKGVLPVAILGSEDFDVTTIDPSSVLLEGFPALEWYVEDVAEVGNYNKGKDGYYDLVLTFDIELIKIAIGDSSEGDIVELILTGCSGSVSDPKWFSGRDYVTVIK